MIKKKDQPNIVLLVISSLIFAIIYSGMSFFYEGVIISFSLFLKIGIGMVIYSYLALGLFYLSEKIPEQAPIKSIASFIVILFGLLYLVIHAIMLFLENRLDAEI